MRLKTRLPGFIESPRGPIPGAAVRSSFGNDILVLSFNLKLDVLPSEAAQIAALGIVSPGTFKRLCTIRHASEINGLRRSR